MIPIIEVNHIYKKYRIGERQSYYTLRDSIVTFVQSVFHPKRDRLEENEFWALKDISFSVNPGEIVGIIGKNGAGKSTLLKILSRITPPTKGEGILRGRVASLLEVGTGFQPELTGRENIYLNGVLLGMKQSEVKMKLDEIVSFAEVEKFLDMPVKHYSSGMYVRLGFAIAAHLNPEILIIDEVLAVGDIEFQKKCLKKMEEIHRSGKTILFVSHNMDSIRRLCKRVIYLDCGRIQLDGRVRTVIHSYAKNE
jgi:lipopolysaccharide transport system ATP-binding protein